MPGSWEWQALIAEEHGKTFGGDENVLYLGYGDDFTAVYIFQLPNCTLFFGWFMSFINPYTMTCLLVC